MTVWFLAFLAVAWIVVYLPSVWRARQSSPFPAVQRFKRSMRTISPRSSAGRWVMVPDSREQVARQARLAAVRAQVRRKRTLAVLITAVVVSGIWAIVAKGNAVELHLIIDALTAFYVALMLDSNRKRVERHTKVHTIHTAPVEHFIEEEPLEFLEAGGGQRS